jgi:hypothetical protein
VTLTVRGGELVVSRVRLPGLQGAATVDGHATERIGDVILLGKQAGDRLVVGVNADGQA